MNDSVWHVSGFGVEPKAKTRRPRVQRIDGVAALRVYRGICEVTANKFELEDVEHDMEALAAAEQYVREYEGDFAYMLSMKDALARFKSLSFGQAKGVLNCLRADVQRSARQSTMVAASVKDEPMDIRNLFLPDATYTVVLADGSHVTLKLSFVKKFDAQVASYLRGSDNESDYTSFAFVNGTSFKMWKRFQYDAFNRQREALACLLSGGLNAAKEAGKLYARTSGKCCVCGRTLTDPQSIEDSMGPICAGKFS